MYTSEAQKVHNYYREDAVLRIFEHQFCFISICKLGILLGFFYIAFHCTPIKYSVSMIISGFGVCS